MLPFVESELQPQKQPALPRRLIETLNQPFRLHRRLHCRPRGCALLERDQVRVGAEVEVDELHPAQHGEQIAVGDAEVFAEQVGLVGEVGVHVAEAAFQVELGGGFPVVLAQRVEEGGGRLVEFGTDEVEPALQAVALDAAVGGRELLFRGEVGDVLDDGRAFGEDFAGVEDQRRHVAAGIDFEVVGAAAGDLGGEVDGFGLVLEACFFEGDVRGQGTGAGFEIELHVVSLVRTGRGFCGLEQELTSRAPDEVPCWPVAKIAADQSVMQMLIAARP